MVESASCGVRPKASRAEDVLFFACAEQAEPAEGFIGNRNSKAFHSPDCTGLPSERNRVEFSTYDEAIAAGYTPCAGCLG